jgi:hypothetical protein
MRSLIGRVKASAAIKCSSVTFWADSRADVRISFSWPSIFKGSSLEDCAALRLSKLHRAALH